jgi:hypothetical protein
LDFELEFGQPMRKPVGNEEREKKGWQKKK